MESVCAYLKKCGVYYLATMEGDQPRVRPFGVAEIFEGKLYFLTGKRKEVSKQLLANPKVEISATSGNTWIRVEALVVEDDRLEARQHILDAIPSLKSMYQADDGNCQVFYLKNATATFYSVGGEPSTVKF
ncbi:MAG: pyridoxamine 5'-phosphate oxidase family protein [Clostridiaceae bacterium]